MSKTLRERCLARLSIELLEKRETPAGNLTSTQMGSSFIFMGTDDFERFQIQAQPNTNSFKVIGQDGTRINGRAEVTYNNVGSLTFNLRGGDDRATVDASVNPTFNLAGSLTFNGGDGNNSLALGSLFAPAASSVRIGGNLIANLGSGDDSVMMQAGGGTVVQGGVFLNFGVGDSNVSARKLTVQGTAGLAVKAFTGDDTFRFSELNVMGNAVFNFGAGDGSVSLDGGFDFNNPGSSLVNGNLTVLVGAGDGSFSVANDLTVNGRLSLTLGEFGSADFGNGDVEVTSLAAVAQNLSVSSSANLLVDVDAFFTGTSSAVVDLAGTTTISGNLTFRGGSGGFGNRFAVDSFADGPLLVGGNATFFTGPSGFSEITIASGAATQSTIGGTLAITGGTGDDLILLDNLRISRDALMKLSSGNNRAAFGQGLGAVEIRGRLTLSTGEGKDSVQFLNATVSQATSIGLSGGADSVSVADSSFASFSLDTADGDDTLNLEPANFGSGMGTSFSGLVLVSMGNGNDTLVIGDDATLEPSVTFAGSAVFNGRLGFNPFRSNRTNFTGDARFDNFVDPDA